MTSLIEKYISLLIETHTDNQPTVSNQPIDFDDLENDGDIKDDKIEKYSKIDDDILKDKKENQIDEFSTCGSVGVMGHMGNTSKQYNKKNKN